MSDYSDVSIIVVAAGSGSRFGSDVPKQFCCLGGRPVVVRAIERLREALPGSAIAVVISPSERKRWKAVSADYGLEDVTVADGGASRWESVKNGLAAVPGSASVVLVHDGARPLVDAALARRVVAATRKSDGAIPVVAVTDSLRMLGDGAASVSVDRSRFRAVQTPQGFNARRLAAAYGLPYSPEFTDDASVMSAAGYDNLLLVEGSVNNIKITNPLDIEIAEIYLRHQR